MPSTEAGLPLLFLTLTLVTGNMYDVFFPEYTASCAGGCVEWEGATYRMKRHSTSPASGRF